MRSQPIAWAIRLPVSISDGFLSLIQAAPEAQRALQERALQLADVRAAVDRATIDLGRTVRTSDTLYYAVDTDLKGENVRLIVVGLRDFDRDSTATLWRIEQRQ